MGIWLLSQQEYHTNSKTTKTDPQNRISTSQVCRTWYPPIIRITSCQQLWPFCDRFKIHGAPDLNDCSTYVNGYLRSRPTCCPVFTRQNISRSWDSTDVLSLEEAPKSSPSWEAGVWICKQDLPSGARPRDFHIWVIHQRFTVNWGSWIELSLQRCII